MRFTPKSDEELSNVWNSDWYQGTVETATETKSAKNNDMLVLEVRIYSNDGRSKVLKDYIVEAVAHKLKHLCDATGLANDYAAGELQPHKLLNKNIEVRLKITIDKNGEYPDKNDIADYRAIKEAPQRAQAKPSGVPVSQTRAANKAAEVSDEEIPF